MAVIPLIQDSAQLQTQTGRRRANANESAFGGLEARALQQVATGVDRVAQVAQDLDDDLNEADARELDNRLSASIRDRLYNADTGYLTTARGRNALDQRSEVAASLQQEMQAIAQAARNERSRAMFTAAAPQRLGDAFSQVERHAAEQMLNYQDEQTEARVQEAQRNAGVSWRDDEVVQRNIGAIGAEFEGLGRRRGWSPEQIANETAKARANAVQDVIRQRAEADPQGVLRSLTAETPEGVYAFLDPGHRSTLVNQVQGELRRREAEARAQQAQYRADLRDTMTLQQQQLRAGIVPRDLLSGDQVSRAFGEDQGQAWSVLVAQAQYAQGAAQMSNRDLARDATAPIAEGAGVDQLAQIAQRRAAASVLRARAEDPMGVAVQTGQARVPDMSQVLDSAISSGNWDEAMPAMRARGADAVQAVTDGRAAQVRPLTRDEARLLNRRIATLNAGQRAGMFANMRRAMTPQAYQGVMAQIAAENPIAAHAGSIAAGRHNLGSLTPRTIGERILEGEDLIHPPQQGDRRATAYPLPSNAKLRERFNNLVGEAYRGLPPGAMDGAFQTFRAYYAYRANAQGIQDTDSVDRDTAIDAANVATGGTFDWNGRKTLLPYGRAPGVVSNIIERQWPQYQQRHPVLRNHGPGDFDLMAVGNGRYKIMEGPDQPVRDNGREIIIRIPDDAQ